jgi:hypothetical protein
MELSVTFDDPGMNWVLDEFTSAVSLIIGTPDPAAPHNKVSRMVRTGGAKTFLGTAVVSHTEFENSMPCARGESRMSVQVGSAFPDIPVPLKAGNEANTVSKDIEGTLTSAGGRETLEYDFANGVDGPMDTSETSVRMARFFDFDGLGDDAAFSGMTRSAGLRCPEFGDD